MTSHQYPDSHVFYRKLTRGYPRIVRGEGCYLYDDQGRRYLDGCGGAYVVNVGHGVSEIADIDHVDRGYEDFEAKLADLGAHAERP